MNMSNIRSGALRAARRKGAGEYGPQCPPGGCHVVAGGLKENRTECGALRAARRKGSGEYGPQCPPGSCHEVTGGRMVENDVVRREIVENDVVRLSPNNIIVSVPKRLFKRAVKRNLLKRRLREAYRTQKGLLPPEGYSILFLYNTKEVLDYAAVREQVGAILQKIAET